MLQLGPAIVPHRCKEMGAELRELNQLAAPTPGSEPSGPRDFTFEDKRRLSQQLGSLPGEVCTWIPAVNLGLQLGDFSSCQ